MITATSLKDISSSMNILYAEDEEILREGMLETLNKFFQKVYIAKNGQEAIEIYKKETIDLVLTDISMPIMDGMKLISEINKIDNNPIIIVLSAHNESRLLQKLINLNINYFLNKPAEKTSLIKMLFRGCSIIYDKKLIRTCTKNLKHENALINRKNRILEQKLNQLATQTNKALSIKKQNSQLLNQTKLNSKTTENESYFKTLLQDDKDELADLSQDLDTYIMMMFQNEILHKNYIEKLSRVYSRYGSVLNSYPEFKEVSEFLQKFTNIIVTLENKFLQNINQTGIYFESLQLTLDTFRQNVWEKEANDPRFYNASLINDIELVIKFLENEEIEDGEIEFF